MVSELNVLATEVEAAIERVTRDCMAGQGFGVHPTTTDDQAGGAGSPFTIVMSPEAADAAQVGYGIGSTDQGASEGGSAVGEFEQLPPEEQDQYFEALTGSGQDGTDEVGDDGRPVLGGCAGEARRLVFPPDGQGPANPLIQMQAAHDSADLAPEVTEAMSAWRDCVAAAGYPSFEDPADAQRYAQYFHYPVGGRPGGPVPESGPWPFDEARQREIELAVADAGCADEHDLREAQAAAADAALVDLLIELEPQIVGYRQEMTGALERTQEILEEV